MGSLIGPCSLEMATTRFEDTLAPSSYDEFDPVLAREIAEEVNRFRRNPKTYAKEMSQLAGCFEGKTLTYPTSGTQIETSEGLLVLKECLQDLVASEPLPVLMHSEAMSSSCVQHLVDMQANDFCSHLGSNGSTPEVRLSRVGMHREQCGENVVFGMTVPQEIVYHMLMDDGSPERGHRANLLNADFHFIGVATGRHPSADSALVVIFADHFKAKQSTRAELIMNIVRAARGESLMTLSTDSAPGEDAAMAQKEWDRLMEELKPAHLKMQAHVVDAIRRANNPKLWRDVHESIPKFALGTLQPLPGIDPSVVRAFIHRIDRDHDDCIEESEMVGICHHYQISISFEEIGSMFDEILHRRHPGGMIKRVVTWSEIYGAVRPHKRWVSVVDMHVERQSEMYQLTMEADELAKWCNEMHLEFAALVDSLNAPPRPGSAASDAGKKPPRNSGAGARAKELNGFMKSLLKAKITSSGTSLRDHEKVRQMFRRPGMSEAEDAAYPITRAVCMSQRRLWAYKTRPFRQNWLKLMRAVGLNPNVALESRHPPEGKGKPIHVYIQEEIDMIEKFNTARPGVSTGVVAGTQGMKVSAARERVEVRPKDKTKLSTTPSGQAPAWEEKRHQTENLVNKCIQGDSGLAEEFFGSLAETLPKASSQTSLNTTAKPKAEMSYTFEARQQFQQVLAKQQRASDERKFLASQKDGTMMVGTRTVGPASLSHPEGVRGHFHNSIGHHAHKASHGWPQSLDVRWDGSHIDHARGDELRPNPKMSKMDAETRDKQFSCYYGKVIPDPHEARAARSSNQYPDVDSYTNWKHHEYREDIPQRYGKFGRRAFDPQVRDRFQKNPHGISEIDSKPIEEFVREQDRVGEFLHRSLPQGQTRHFKQHMPNAEKPHKYEDMVNREQIRFLNDGGQKKNVHGFGQNRHSDDSDYKLYTRPVNASQMDRNIPMC
mmetsp:Transcript_38990/g.70386  ORF Transcript_38990/g.70386 Transcript_38990/m.70386 type:complete len:945 (-) Transcript_38990:95-2929(-)